MLNKLNELEARLSTFQPDILAITEVCPKHYCVTIPPESLHFKGYDLFCSDFSNDRGMCLYCKSTLKAEKYDNLKSNDFNESLWCSVPVSMNNFILVGVIYCLPSSTVHTSDNLMDLITEAINVTHNCKSHLLILGDSNYPGMNGHLVAEKLSTLYDFNT